MRKLRRYSLRTFLLATAIVCASVGFPANRAHEQRRAVSFIRSLDKIYVGYDRSVDDLPLPAWLLQVLGEHWFASVVEVHLGDGITSDHWEDVIRHLSRLPRLRTVYLRDANVVDEDLQHLTSLTQITHLGLHFSRKEVTGSGIAAMTSMDNIRRLELSGRSIDNDVLRYLSQFSSLEWLSIRWYRADDDGIHQLGKCKKLAHVTLSSCHCRVRDLHEILRIESLESLHFRNIQIGPSNLVPWNEGKTNAHLVDRNPIVLYPWNGLDVTNPNQFELMTDQFRLMTSWMVAQRPSLKISSSYQE